MSTNSTNMDADDSLLSSENNDTVSASSFPQTQLLNLRNDSSVNGGVTPLEQEVLDEYSRLLGNMNQVSEVLTAAFESTSSPIWHDGHWFRLGTHTMSGRPRKQ